MGPLLGGGVLGLLTMVLGVRRLRREHAAFLILSVGTMAGVASPGYFFPHYYVQLFPVMALACAGGLAFAPSLLRSRVQRLALVSAGALLVGAPTVLGIAVPLERVVPQPNTSADVALVPAERRQAAGTETLETEAFIEAWDQRNIALGQYLRAQTSDGDLIYVRGGATHSTPTYFYASRMPAVRDFLGAERRFGLEDRDTLVMELLAARPRYIVDTFQADYRYNADPEHTERTEAFLALLDEHYKYVGTMHFADVYQLSSGSDPKQRRELSLAGVRR